MQMNVVAMEHGRWRSVRASVCEWDSHKTGKITCRALEHYRSLFESQINEPIRSLLESSTWVCVKWELSIEKFRSNLEIDRQTNIVFARDARESDWFWPLELFPDGMFTSERMYRISASFAYCISPLDRTAKLVTTHDDDSWHPTKCCSKTG